MRNKLILALFILSLWLWAIGFGAWLANAKSSQASEIEPSFDCNEGSQIGWIVALDRKQAPDASAIVIRTLTEDCINELFWLREGKNGNLWMMCDQWRLSNRYVTLGEVQIGVLAELKPGDWLKFVGSREQCEMMNRPRGWR